VESLTGAIERGAQSYLDEIEKLGGAVRAIELGFQQREIHEAAYRWQRRVESGEAVVVGVNRFREKRQARPQVLRVDETLQGARSGELARLRAERDGAAVERALADLELAARGEANLMPRILEAVERYATLGEIADRLRSVFGVHQERFAL
jgi:methylmalonyl-CoA mutase N-terminal domain/subunit